MSGTRLIQPGLSRRKFIKGIGASMVAAPFLNALTGCTSDGSSHRTRLVLLGTTGGVTWWPSTTRTSSSSAIMVGETMYLIDVGQGSTTRLTQAFNTGDSYTGSGSTTFLKNLKALFLTHLHQDHTADYPALLLIGVGSGMNGDDPLQVIGPCNRGQLEINKTGFPVDGVIWTDSSDPSWITPTPGTAQMTETVWQAFAQTINNMTLDAAYPDFRKTVQCTEIGTPLATQDSPTCPATPPFEIYRDDLVQVTATLVDHHQVYPAFAFRFDTDDGSIVFSGDTGPETNGNLQTLADGADILVHEVIDRVWIDYKFPEPSPLKTHMLEAHTAIDAVGAVAESCRVKTLVLNHIVPGDTPMPRLLEAGKNFSGRLIVGEDLMQIGI
ncbi:MAG: MBL fold metallo-hydrolase [Deltaproteobacteria bacterium]|nr:MBL fold metallo-hydrolase [Deltaproteobacteria bacterium]